MLSTHSFNALLKTLEEPPPHVKFLLATTDPQKLPVTILSRCLQFNLKNLSPERISKHLQFVLGEEAVPFEEAALWQLSRSADGSMRDALSLTDQAIAHGAGKVTESEVNAMLGTIDRSRVVDLCKAVAAGDGENVLSVVAQMAEHAPDFNTVLADILGFWHRVAIAQTVPEALDNRHGDYQQVVDLAQSVNREDVQLYYQIALLGRRDLTLSPDARTGFEMALLRQLAFKPGSSEMRAPGSAAPGTSTMAQPGEGNPAKKSQPPAPELPPTEAHAVVDKPSMQEAPLAQEPLARKEPLANNEPSADKEPSAAKKPSGSPESHPPAQQAAQEILPEKSPLMELAASLEQPAAPVAKPAEPEQPEPLPELQSQAPAASKAPAVSKEMPSSWIEICQQLKLSGVLGNTAANLVLEERTASRFSVCAG